MSDRENSISTVEVLSVLDQELFKAFSEPIRVKLLKHLALNGPADVGSIADFFPQDRSVISRHLKLMQQADILCSHKEARRVVYAINGADLLAKLEKIVALVRSIVDQCCPGKASGQR